MTRRFVNPWYFAVVLAIGCGGNSGDDGGGATACIAGQFCAANFVCINGFCLPAGGTTNSSMDETSMSNSTTDDPTSDGTTDDSTTNSTTDDPTDPTDDPTDPTDDPTDPTDDPTMGNPDIPAGAPCQPKEEECPLGQKCAAYANGGSEWNDNHCVYAGDGELGDPCSYTDAPEGEDTCGVGLVCWHYDDFYANGTCIPKCTDGNPSCEAGQQCFVNNDVVYYCLPWCDPLGDDCDANQGCYWDGQVDSFICYADGDIPAGEPCSFINDCEPGHLCTLAEFVPNCNGSGCCSPWCDVDTPMCPNNGTECTQFITSNAPPGFEDVGLCALP